MFGRLARLFRGKSVTKVDVGQLAPPFTLKDASGKSHSLSEALERGPVLAAFFKISCPVCQFTFPFLERIHKAYSSEKMTVWGISQDDAADTKEFCQEYGVSFPALLDEDSYGVSNAFGLTNVPSVFFIGQDGKVSVSTIGFGKKELQQMAAEAARAAGKPVQPVFRSDEAIPEYKPG